MDESSRERIERRLAPSLGRVRAPSGAVAGGGFLVAPRRVMTCAHVVNRAVGAAGSEPAHPAGVVQLDFPAFPEAATIEARVLRDGWFPVAEDGRGNVAVLELLEAPPEGVVAPPLRRPPVLPGRRVRVEGFSAGTATVWATGVVRGATEPGREWLRLEAVELCGGPVEPCFSGAPVWDDDAEAVVGMVVAADGLREARVAEMIPVAVLARRWAPLEAAVGWQLRFDAERCRHWLPRARGLAKVGRDEPRWLFSGREQALRELVDWLEVTPGADRQGRVVTGLPGSGKSAVLARLVVLADRYERAHVTSQLAPGDALPPVGAVDVAVHARGKTLDGVVAELAAGLDLPGACAGEVVEVLLEAELPRAIVLDALDEASGGEAAKIAVELLRPLAEHGSRFGLKLLVGTRRGRGRDLLRGLGSHMRELDLDAPDYLDRADLVEYVRCTLLERAPAGPYRQRRERLSEIAEAVASRASPSFLVAQLVARDLAERDEPVDTAPGWRAQLAGNVADATERYLHRFRADEQRVRDLLRPLAYAEGGGLPGAGTLWPTLAAELAGRPYTPADISWLLRSPAARCLVAGGDADDALSYRVSHQALAEHLKGERHREQQARITAALLSTVPALPGGSGRDWRSADPYLHEHLAAHAAAGGVLDALIEDAGYLVAADPSRLLLALPALTAPSATRQVYRQAFQALRNSGPAERASYLEMTARQAGADDLAERIAHVEPDRPWSTEWARWQRPGDHFIAGDHKVSAWGAHGERLHWGVSPHGRVNAVAVGELDGRPIAVSGGDDQAVRVWDLAAGLAVGEPITGHAGFVNAVAVGELDGRPVAVSGDQEAVRVWDLVTGVAVGEPLAGHAADVTSIGYDGAVLAVALGVLDGRPVAVSGGTDGTLRVWDLPTGVALGEPLHGHGGWVRAVAVGELDGRPIAVSAGDDGAVRVWDLAAGIAVGEPLQGHAGQVHAVAVGELDGRPIAVSGHDDGTVRVWDLATGVPVGEPLTGHEHSVYAVAVGELDGRPIAVSCGHDQAVRVWDLAAGVALGGPLHGHTDWLSTIAVGELDGRPIAVSGGNDETVRVWDLATAIARGEPPTSHTRTVTAVAVGELDGRPIAVSGGWDAVRVWDLAAGAPLGEPLTGHVAGVWAVAVGELDGRPIAVCGAAQELRVWDLAAGSPVGEPLPCHASPVYALAVGKLDGRPIAVSGGWHDAGKLRVWDLAAGVALGKPLRGHRDWVNAVALGELDGRPIAVSGGDEGMRVWDLAARVPIGKPLRGHAGTVRAVAVGALDGRPIAVSGGSDGTVRVWDLAAGVALGEPLTRHADQVYAVAAGDLDGRPVAVSGGLDATLRISELSGSRSSTLTVHSAVQALAFAAPSKTLVATRQGVMLIKFAAALLGAS